MAITDINFTEGEKQLFTLEIALGALNAPVDEDTEPASAQYPVLETQISIVEPTEGDIFILVD